MKNKILKFKSFNEGIVNTVKNIYNRKVGNYKYYISIKISLFKNGRRKDSFIENKYIQSDEVNRELMLLLDNKFNLNLLYISSVNRLDVSKISDIKNFLLEIGLNFNEIKKDRSVEYFFTGKMTLKDIKNIK